MNATEQEVQQLVFRHLRGEIISPSSMVFAWEADVINVRRNFYISEYEIKLTRSDYLADFRKDFPEWNWELREKKSRLKHDVLQRGDTNLKRPNKFYFVLPKDMVEGVPDYCGWLEFYRLGNGYLTLQLRRKAPFLHKDKITLEQLYQIAGSLANRHWDAIKP